MLYLLYNFALILLLIVLSPVWIIILLSGRKHRAGFFPKLGLYSAGLKEKLKSFSRKPVWFHAVSVGECLAIVDLVREFNRMHPEVPVVLSTTTRTGNDIAYKKLGDVSTIIYFPYDIGFITSKVINLIRPAVVCIVETEIWPNFSYNLHRKNIPLMLINGRISPKSFRNYYKYRKFVRKMLPFFTEFLMQSRLDARRIRRIGAQKDKITVTGNIKYDIKKTLTDQDISKLREELELKEDDQVLIAGSTHAGEESILLDQYKRLRDKISGLKLVLVPRHPERYGEVIELLKEKEILFGKRSTKNTFKDVPVLLLDTMGELSGFYSIAKVAFVGGSLVERGGHNPLEPAIYNVPVVMGQYTFNFYEICNYMERAGAIIRVNNAEGLYRIMLDLFLVAEEYAQVQNACSRVFRTNTGATKTILRTVEKYL